MADKSNSSDGKQKVKPLFGLALSGGGFRASFFHIGVLARLAELDLLRSVEAISTVSGGSIIGALYYLHLKKLLECKKDEDIKRSDYMNLVTAIETDFMLGVERNIRTRTFSNLKQNLRMYGRNYSRSDRISELYDRFFYAPVVGRTNISLPDLKIQPYEHEGEFHPDYNNGKRRAKIPRLIINATCLNTGHNWQFTASYMGEPPVPADHSAEMADIDKNMRLRRLYYHESSVPKIRKTPLRVAVAASAAVPGLFPPLPITELYDDMIVQLVDGGVYDNQGVISLMLEGCRTIIVSDASGQLPDMQFPKPTIMASVGRTNQILMDVVRESALTSLYQRTRFVDAAFGKLDCVKFIHLKKELTQPEITWIGGMSSAPSAHQRHGGMTSYGVDRNVQDMLSHIRTDLDTFSEVEAYSLMLSAYLISTKELQNPVLEHICSIHGHPPATPNEEVDRGNWKFFGVQEFMCKNSGNRLFVKQLEAASQRAFKAVRIAPVWLKGILGGLALAGSAWVGWFIWQNWNTGFTIEGSVSLTFEQIAIGIGLLLIPVLFPSLPWARNQRNYVREWAVRLVVAVVGWILCWINLLTLDPLFKYFGRLKRLKAWKGVDY